MAPRRGMLGRMYDFQSPPDLSELSQCAGCRQQFVGREGGWHDRGHLWHTRCREWSCVATAPYAHLERPLRKLWGRLERAPVREQLAQLGRWLTESRRCWPADAAHWLDKVRPRLDALRSELRREGIRDPGF